MKNLPAIICMVLLFLCTLTTLSQQSLSSRPSLFAKLPSVINCTATQLDTIFSPSANQLINISFGKILFLSGTVKSNTQKYKNLQTVVIKLSVFQNILFTISKITNEDNSFTYVAHLYDRAYADGYELKKTDQLNYQFIKVAMEEVLPVCNQ